MAETLIRLCPHVTMIATSREILRIEGEYIYRVSPLDVPADARREPDHILGHSAVELFIARAEAQGLEDASRREMLPAIGGICRHLDGIPLAIEFAAARAAVLGIEEVAASLHDRFTAMTIGRRTADQRHRTLRATLDWSYDLLPADEQLLLRRLAVFPAGFAIEAAAAVMSRSGFDPAAVLYGIANLVAKSLVVLEAEEFFAQAGALSRGQGALLWELRAALSLARSRVRQGRLLEGRQILGSVYERFTEGLGTVELRKARALLEMLPLT